MGVVARLYEDEYGPEFSSVVIRDGVFEGGVDAGVDEPALLTEHAGPLWGTVARAGAGWLQLDASDSYQRVLIEAHDAEPRPETEPWQDVLETPYVCFTGTVGLTSTTSGPAQAGIRLGEPGRYRVRVCRRAAEDEGYDWAVRFWRAELRPPAWLARGPEKARGSLADDVYALASWAPGGRLTTSLGELAKTLLAGRGDVRAALAESGHLAVTGRRRLDIRALSDEGEDGEEPPATGTTGPPPRLGYLTGTSGIMLLRGDRVVELARSPVGTPWAMVEYDGGVVVVGGKAVTLRWDGHMRLLGAGGDLGRDFTISRDGRTLAGQEWWKGKDPFRRLHVFDLAGEQTYTMPWPDNREWDVQIMGVDEQTVWFRSGGQQLTWTVGDSAPVPATAPPPSAGWAGPTAPRHPFFFSPEQGRSVAVGENGTLDVTDDGHTRTYPLPRGARKFGSARPVWETPDHLLLPVQEDPQLGDYLLRVDVTTGAWEIAGNERIFALIWPWPHRTPGAGPPPLPRRDPATYTMTSLLAAGPGPSRPPDGPAARIGHIAAGRIVVPRAGHPVTIARTSLPYLDWAVETAAGVLVQGGVALQTNNRDTRLEFARWDGSVLQFGTDPRGVAISRDGSTAAVHELHGGRRPFSRLHLVGLHDGTRHTLELAIWDFELRITGVDHQTIWFRSRDLPAEMQWSAGAADPVPATGPPPVSGWDDPDAPSHQLYPAAGERAYCHVDRSTVRVHGRSFPLPGDFPAFNTPPAAWEDPHHLLVSRGRTIFRLDTATGTFETTDTDTDVSIFVQAWPHKPEAR